MFSKYSSRRPEMGISHYKCRTFQQDTHVCEGSRLGVVYWNLTLQQSNIHMSSSRTRSRLARIAASWSRRLRKAAKQSPAELAVKRTAGLRSC
jgi:hypothetical protein